MRAYTIIGLFLILAVIAACAKEPTSVSQVESNEVGQATQQLENIDFPEPSATSETADLDSIDADLQIE